jgi:hypothetical protein
MSALTVQRIVPSFSLRRDGVGSLDLYSLLHSFASLGRTATGSETEDGSTIPDAEEPTGAIYPSDVNWKSIKAKLMHTMLYLTCGP